MECMHLNAHYILIDFVHFFYLFYFLCPMWVFYRCVLLLLVATKSTISMLLSIEGAQTSHNCSLMSLGKVNLFNGTSFFKLSHIFAHSGTSLNTNQKFMKLKLMCFGCFNLQSSIARCHYESSHIHSLPLQPCNTHKTWQHHFFYPHYVSNDLASRSKTLFLL